MIPVVRGLVAPPQADGSGGLSVLMIERVMQAVMNLAGHVWVLAQGGLIALGTPAQVTADERVVEAYFGRGSAARLRVAATP